MTKHRDGWDFFLFSQFVTHGTAWPTRYIVVRDDGMFREKLQSLTYKLTHMYYNCTGTVRVPAPCKVIQKKNCVALFEVIN